MHTKNYLLWLVCILMSGTVLVSCSDDDKPAPIPEPVVVKHGLYILNSGSWGSNNSTLDFYNFENGELNENIYEAVNGKELGDTANDLLVYGSKIYIAVNVSNQIVITDMDGKSLQQITPENGGSAVAGPRCLAAYGGKVYVSLYDGYIARIDTTSLTIEAKVEVGVGVEQMCINEDKPSLYAAISSNPLPSSLVKEVDLTSFKVTKELDVVINPTQIAIDKNGYLYVLSSGTFENKYANKLVKVDPATGDVVVLLENSKLFMSTDGNDLYILSSLLDENWMAVSTDYLKYNMTTQKFEDKPFVDPDVKINYAQIVFPNSDTAEIYIASGDFVSNGDLHIVDKAGKVVKEIPVSGINPICVRYVNIQE